MYNRLINLRRAGAVAALMVVALTSTVAPASAAEQAVVEPPLLTVTPSTTSITPDETFTVAIQTRPGAGVPRSLSLLVSGLPFGTTSSLAPATVQEGESSTLTVTAKKSVEAGTFHVEVEAYSPGVGGSSRAAFDLTVSGLTTSLNPSAATVAPGESASTTVTVAAPKREVFIYATNLPADLTVTASPSTVRENGTVDVTISTTSQTPPGTYDIRINGSAPGMASVVKIFQLTIPGAIPGCTARTDASVWVPFNWDTYSYVKVEGCGRNASRSTLVDVHLQSGYIEGLTLDVLTPNGYSRRIKGTTYPPDLKGMKPIKDAVFTFEVDASISPADGVWQLKLREFDPPSIKLVDWTIRP